MRANVCSVRGAAAAALLAVAGCGGKGADDERSAGQQAYEALVLGAGAHGFHWDLELAGSQTSGANYLFSDSVSLTASPAIAGPQAATESPPVNVAAALPLVVPKPTRIITDGQVLVVPATGQATRVSYAGADVQVDHLAADGATVAYGVVQSGHTFQRLAGTVAGSPAELAHWYNSLFANPAILAPAATYRAGAGYLRFTVTSRADRYDAFDCYAATTGAVVSPCLTGTRLSAALTAGITSASDGVTYHLADGALRTVGGIEMWIATAPRPQVGALSSTLQYRIYWQAGNDVSTGRFIPAGTVLGGSYHVSNPSGATPADRLTFLSYWVRLNEAARDSIAAAVSL